MDAEHRVPDRVGCPLGALHEEGALPVPPLPQACCSAKATMVMCFLLTEIEHCSWKWSTASDALCSFQPAICLRKCDEACLECAQLLTNPSYKSASVRPSKCSTVHHFLMYALIEDLQQTSRDPTADKGPLSRTTLHEDVLQRAFLGTAWHRSSIASVWLQ